MQTLQNGVMVPTNSDPYNLTADLAAMGSSSGVVIPVASQAIQDGLTKLLGRVIVRTDLPSQPMFRCDSVNWLQITGVQHAEYTGPALTTTAGTGVNFGGAGGGLFSNDATRTVNNGFVQPDSAGKVKILQSGTYALSAIILPTTAPAAYSLQINDSTSAAVLASVGGTGYGNKEQSIAAPNVYLAANTVIEFTLVTSTAVTLGSRVRLTKVQ